MVVHTCPTCQKEFSKKSTYIDHIENKKKPCQPKVVEITQNNTKNTQKIAENTQFIIKNPLIMAENTPKVEYQENLSCRYCLKVFSRTDSLKRHMSTTCKVIKLENEKKQNIFNNLVEIDDIKKKFETIIVENKNLSEGFDLLKKQNDLLIKQNEELNSKIGEILKKNINTTHNTNITNNTQNITQNINQNINQNISITPIKLNAFGKENLKTIKYDELEKIITDTRQNGKYCFNRIIDLIHFNNNLPENQNVYMPDYNRGKFMYYNGNDWELTQDDENIIFQVLEHVRKLYNINNNEELEEKLETDREFNRKFNTTFKKYYDWVFDEVDDNELSAQELKKKNDFKEMMSKEIVNKLYNNRNKVKKNYEKFDRTNQLLQATEILKIK